MESHISVLGDMGHTSIRGQDRVLGASPFLHIFFANKGYPPAIPPACLRWRAALVAQSDAVAQK